MNTKAMGFEALFIIGILLQKLILYLYTFIYVFTYIIFLCYVLFIRLQHFVSKAVNERKRMGREKLLIHCLARRVIKGKGTRMKYFSSLFLPL